MKRVMIVGLVMMGLIACNHNGTTNSGDTTPDSAYNNPTATDSGQGIQSSGSDTLDSTHVKAGAGAGTGSGAQASQDTGSGAKRQ